MSKNITIYCSTSFHDYINTNSNPSGIVTAHAASNLHHTKILTDLGVIGTGDAGWEDYDEAHENGWVSVFGTSNADATLPFAASSAGVSDNAQGTTDWKNLVGDETLSSPFQDGHYVYSVVAGGGSGSSVYPPVLYVGDIENMTDFNNVLEP